MGSNGSTGGVHLAFFQFLGNLLSNALRSFPSLILYLSTLNNYTLFPCPYVSEVLVNISF